MARGESEAPFEQCQVIDCTSWYAEHRVRHHGLGSETHLMMHQPLLRVAVAHSSQR